MKENIYEVLNTIYPCFYRSAPDENVEYPIIIYYFITNQPLYFGDNKASKSRRIVFNVSIYDEKDVDEKVIEIIDALELQLGAVFRNETDISDEDLYGTSLEFELNNFIN